MHIIKQALFVFLILIVFSCKKTTQQEQPSPSFKLLDSDQTGLQFANNLDVNLDFNIFKYMYYYNGSGVGVGDFNGDGLQDLFHACHPWAQSSHVRTWLSTAG